MSKKFDIHEWQAKQRRLNEGMSQESMSNEDITNLMVIVADYSLNKILNTMAILVDRQPNKQNEADMIKKLANQIQDFEPTDMDEISATGTGASFQAGSGEGYATPYAFKKRKKKISEIALMYQDTNLDQIDNKKVNTPQQLAVKLFDIAKRLKKGEIKGLDTAEILEVADMLDLMLGGASQDSLASVFRSLEKTLKTKID